MRKDTNKNIELMQYLQREQNSQREARNIVDG